MDDPIRDMIQGYLDLPGVMAALLVSDQGLVINKAQRGDVDTDMISALVMDTLVAAQRFGREAQVGRLDTICVDFERLSVLLAPFEQDILLALVAAPGTFEPRTKLPA